MREEFERAECEIKEKISKMWEHVVESGLAAAIKKTNMTFLKAIVKKLSSERITLSIVDH